MAEKLLDRFDEIPEMHFIGCAQRDLPVDPNDRTKVTGIVVLGVPLQTAKGSLEETFDDDRLKDTTTLDFILGTGSGYVDPEGPLFREVYTQDGLRKLSGDESTTVNLNWTKRNMAGPQFKPSYRAVARISFGDGSWTSQRLEEILDLLELAANQPPPDSEQPDAISLQ